MRYMSLKRVLLITSATSLFLLASSFKVFAATLSLSGRVTAEGPPPVGVSGATVQVNYLRGDSTIYVPPTPFMATTGGGGYFQIIQTIPQPSPGFWKSVALTVSRPDDGSLTFDRFLFYDYPSETYTFATANFYFPEPLSTLFGSAIALGFGGLLKREYSKNSKKVKGKVIR